MSGFYIDRIRPSEGNARIITELTHDDLRRSGLSVYSANQIADPSNIDHIERQIILLQDYPERYLGATALRSLELIGFCNTSEWTAYDQLPFSRGIEKLGLLALTNLGDNRLNNQPSGIHELAIDGSVDYRDSVISELLDRVIIETRPREIRIAKYSDSPVDLPLRQKGFEPTGKYGILNGTRQQIYSRQPYIPVTSFYRTVGLQLQIR